MTRKLWVGGNWKCNGSRTLVDTLSKHFNENYDCHNIETCLFVPSLFYCCLKNKLTCNMNIGLQNISKFGNGAYTGEISAEICKDFEINCALVGHSERRTIFDDNNETIKMKLDQMNAHDLNIVFCIGEKLEERESDETFNVCKFQLSSLIEKIKNFDNVVIAYEPVWAIGTGKVATKEQAQEVHKFIRQYIQEKISAEVAKKIRIVYGGSVNLDNCVELIKQPDIDGFLIGGASLKKSFIDILKIVEQQQLSQ